MYRMQKAFGTRTGISSCILHNLRLAMLHHVSMCLFPGACFGGFHVALLPTDVRHA